MCEPWNTANSAHPFENPSGWANWPEIFLLRLRAPARTPGRHRPWVDLATEQAMIEENTTGRLLGFLGEPAVNVLELNMELDQRYPYRA